MSTSISAGAARAIYLHRQWICQSCIQKRNMVTKFTTRAKIRKIQSEGRTWKLGEKVLAADRAWAEKAVRIRAGEEKSLWQTLKERGFIHHVAGDEKELERTMIDKSIAVYAGIDPTGPSMHVGHLLPMMVLLWYYVHGYGAYTLLGGSTSRIGDPSGRTTSRDRQASATRKANMASMHLQITNIWDNMEKYATTQYNYRRQPSWKRSMINNNSWWNRLPVMEFMHYAGQLARVGSLLSRDTAKRKLEGNTGLSFAELGYPIMQGWDWWELYKRLDVQLQIGGADQFGNIITGMEVVNDIVPRVINPDIEAEKFDTNSTRFGFTVPLLTTSSGEKIGKSAGNAIWLDHAMTTPFDLYGYFLSLSDSDAIRFLKLFTLMPLSEIVILATEHAASPSKRLAHHRLAFDVLTLVHGLPTASSTANAHFALFGRKLALPPQPPKSTIPAQHPGDLNASTNPNATPISSESLWSHNITLPRSLVTNTTPARILFHAGLVSSRSEGQRLINANGAWYGGEAGTPVGLEATASSTTTTTSNSPSTSPNPSASNKSDSSSSNVWATTREMPDELKFVRIANVGPEMCERMLIGGHTMILRAGKTKVRVIRVVSDEEFEERGLDAPGWTEWKEKRDGTGEERERERVGVEGREV